MSQQTIRRNCPLCLRVLEMTQTNAQGETSSFAFRHIAAECARSTEERIKVLEAMHVKNTLELESQSGTIDELGQWVASCTRILGAGRRWIEHRDKRAEDIARLRKAFGTGDRNIQHPLWLAEEDLAAELAAALQWVDTRSKRS